MKLRFLTINVHKGFSALNRRFILPRLREAVRASGADVIFLQEVVGENRRKAARRKDWPAAAQHEYLAEGSGLEHVYGRNAVYAAGHHGNAILSRFPMQVFERVDVSTNRFEQRGLLYCLLKPPGAPALHCVCVHLGLFSRSRKKQVGMLRDYISRHVPPASPLVVAGDFNEWRRRQDELETGLGMAEAGRALTGARLPTFPAALPVLPLDRFYLRGLEPLAVGVLRSGAWKSLSDHAAVYAEAGLAAGACQARPRAS